jgi:serine/threonine protein kinase
MQLEAVLEEFEQALRNAADGKLPDLEYYLAGWQGDARNYLEQEMRSLLRHTVRGNYLVLNPIESGGMGSVSKVRHLRLGKVMALKEIRSDALQIGDRDEVLRRFHREIELCGRMDEHPNIVSYTDTGVDEAGVPFLVMDYIDGEDLGKIVRRAGPLHVNDAAQAIHDAAIGLAHAHDHGLIHRDVKPSNIMISRHGTVKVLDFGLARIATGDHKLTALTTGKVMGTFDYMSPELCREITPDLRGDIYSLGCTLYFALAGRAPFDESKSQFEKMDAHLHAEPAPIPRLDDDPELRAILRKMMAKSPEDRYANAHEVAAALAPFCQGADLRALVRSGRNRAAGDPPSDSREAPRRGQANDSSDRTTNSKAADKTAEWTRLRRKRGRRFVLTAVLLAAGVALLSSLLIADAWQHASRERELAKALGALPGLNGRWWFDEAPWLLPDVRLALIASLADAEEESRQKLLTALPTNSDAPAVYELLDQFKDRFRRHWPSDVRAHLSTVEAFDPEAVNPADFALSLRTTANSIDSKPRASLTGAELHLRAVIHHYLQELEPASRMYDEAVKKYEQENQPALRALCLLDWGELLHGFRQSASAHSKFNLAWREFANSLAPGESLPPLFELYAKAMEADSHRRIDNMKEAESLLGRAWQIAETLPERHPLRALVLERRGWLHLDLWELEKAQDDFEQALSIRRSHEPENHRARHFIYWDQQGVGMAKMYQGEATEARKLFRELLAEIDSPPRRITTRQRTELEDRRPNLYERLADTALFTGSDELDGMMINPVDELEAAIQYAESLNFAEDGRRAVLIRLHYKGAVVRALRGENPSRAQEHRRQAVQLETEARTKSSSGSQSTVARPPTYELTKKIALAVLAWKSGAAAGQESGRRELREIVETAGSGLSRDDLLLLLYVGENLLESEELTPVEETALAEQIRQVIRVQPFPPAQPGDSHSPPRIPGVFRRYLEMAEQVAAQE